MKLEKREKPELRTISTIAVIVAGISMLACIAGCSTASAPLAPAQPAMSAPVAPSVAPPAPIAPEAVETAPTTTAPTDREPKTGIVFEGGGADGYISRLNGRLPVKIGSPKDGQLVLVWLLAGTATPHMSPASGYKQIGSTWIFNHENTAAALYYHFWKTGDPTTLNFQIGFPSSHCDWAYALYSGVNPATPFDGKPREATKDRATRGWSPSVTPGAGNNADMLLMLYGEATATRGTANSPSLGTIRAQIGYIHIAVWVDAALSSSKPTGVQTINSELPGNWIGVQALLLPQSNGRSASNEGGGGTTSRQVVASSTR